MSKFERQYDLFKYNDPNYSIKTNCEDLHINKKIITTWQNKIINFQSKVFASNDKSLNQYSLFESHINESQEKFNPLELTPLPLSFWRWPIAKHKGPAVYFVIDKIINQQENIILYIGETLFADKRWKGDHDCKIYLSNYCESLQKAGLITNLDIRFWIDVPKETKERRKLEKKLIQTWQPPFNKETRGYWSTPFTSQIN
tara:strand:- start:1016 stop:1615 length:600 start_codon:yes stop_codon:yes gene_type:complete